MLCSSFHMELFLHLPFKGKLKMHFNQSKLSAEFLFSKSQGLWVHNFKEFDKLYIMRYIDWYFRDSDLLRQMREFIEQNSNSELDCIKCTDDLFRYEMNNRLNGCSIWNQFSMSFNVALRFSIPFLWLRFNLNMRCITWMRHKRWSSSDCSIILLVNVTENLWLLNDL